MFKKRTNGAPLWLLPNLFIGLLYRTCAQHDGPSLGCRDGDDQNPGHDQDIYLAKQEETEMRQGKGKWTER